MFDRVRETFKKNRKMSARGETIAITSTISAAPSSPMAQMMVLSMLLFGGETLYYALALTIGICFGIYSSVLVASPLVMAGGVARAIHQPKKEKEGRWSEAAFPDRKDAHGAFSCRQDRRVIVQIRWVADALAAANRRWNRAGGRRLAISSPRPPGLGATLTGQRSRRVHL